MSDVHEAGVLRRRRRRRRRAVLTMTSVLLLLGGTLVYAVGNVPGIGRGAPAHRPPAACSPGRSSSGVPLPAPDTVRVNVYNATSRQGLAGSLARPTCGRRGSPCYGRQRPPAPPPRGARRDPVRAGRGALAAQRAASRMAGARLVRDHRRDADHRPRGRLAGSGAATPAAAPRPTGAAGAGASRQGADRRARSAPGSGLGWAPSPPPPRDGRAAARRRSRPRRRSGRPASAAVRGTPCRTRAP